MFTNLLVFVKLVLFGNFLPNIMITTGELCSVNNVDFIGLYYKDQVPKCKRNFSIQHKIIVAEKYGIFDKTQWKYYEFDHLIPLAIGGSNDISNVWPQFKNKNQILKNRLEFELYSHLRNGTITQKEAVHKIFTFMCDNYNVKYNDCF